MRHAKASWGKKGSCSRAGEKDTDDTLTVRHTTEGGKKMQSGRSLDSPRSFVVIVDVKVAAEVTAPPRQQQNASQAERANLKILN